MKDSEILELIGKGLAHENVTKAKTTSAGRTLMEVAPRIAALEAENERLRALATSVCGDEFATEERGMSVNCAAVPKADLSPAVRGRHTPGPWYEAITQVVDAQGAPVAQIADRPEFLENKALIAAAPELISVLRDCLSYMDAMAFIRGGEASELRLKCRAAIALAEGRK